jgi:hypothetical protein
MLNYQRVIQIINPSKPAAAKAPLFQLRQVRPRRRDARHLALLAHSVTHRWQGRQGRLLDEMFGKAMTYGDGMDLSSMNGSSSKKRLDYVKIMRI